MFRGFEGLAGGRSADGTGPRTRRLVAQWRWENTSHRAQDHPSPGRAIYVLLKLQLGVGAVTRASAGLRDATLRSPLNEMHRGTNWLH